MTAHENTEDGGPQTPPWKDLGAGLITGAADDDPSGIATYSQVGAAFGYGMLWCVLVTMPLMIAIQAISAGIGRVTGHGLMDGMRLHYPRQLVYALLALICVANVINLAADIGAMGAALKLLIGGPALLYAALFAGLSLLLQVFIPFTRYAPILKLLTLSLFAYVATVLVIDVPWRAVLRSIVLPPISWNAAYAVGLVALLGTTISPTCFAGRPPKKWRRSRRASNASRCRTRRNRRPAPCAGSASIPRWG
jgi:Mn2+/Fe2+ NRAMP family transporter